jgi:hypothetical protein
MGYASMCFMAEVKFWAQIYAQYPQVVVLVVVLLYKCRACGAVVAEGGSETERKGVCKGFCGGES